MQNHSLKVFLFQEKKRNCLTMSDMFINSNYQSQNYYLFEQALKNIQTTTADVILIAINPQNKSNVQTLFATKQKYKQDIPLILIVHPQNLQWVSKYGYNIIKRPVRIKQIQDLINLVPVRSLGSLPSKQLTRQIRVLGQGAAGTVKLVQNIETRQKFAVKIINLQILSPTQKQKTAGQIIFLKILQCPNIIKYRYSDQQKNNLLIYMEYAQCGTLADLIAEHLHDGTKFSIQEILDYMAQITMALQYVHSKNVMHRDIKPHNVFLSKNNIVKLGDFGISKNLNQGKFASTYIGTPYYMAPQIIRNQNYDSRADIWSFGCLIYQLCYLNKPFYGQSQYDLYQLIVNCNVQISIQIPQYLNDLIKRMLRKQPKQRISIRQISKLPMIQQAKNKFLIRLKQHHPQTNLNIQGYSTNPQFQQQQLQLIQKLTKDIISSLPNTYTRQSFFSSPQGPFISQVQFQTYLDKLSQPKYPIQKFIQLRFFKLIQNRLLPFSAFKYKPSYCKNDYTYYSTFKINTNGNIKQDFQKMLNNQTNLKAIALVDLQKLHMKDRPAFLVNLWKVINYHKIRKAKLNSGWVSWIKSFIPFKKQQCAIILNDQFYTLSQLQQLILADKTVPPQTIFLLAQTELNQQYLSQLIDPIKFFDIAKMQAKKWCYKWFSRNQLKGQIYTHKSIKRFHNKLGTNNLLELMGQYGPKYFLVRQMIKQIESGLLQLFFIQ